VTVLLICHRASLTTHLLDYIDFMYRVG